VLGLVGHILAIAAQLFPIDRNFHGVDCFVIARSTGVAEGQLIHFTSNRLNIPIDTIGICKSVSGHIIQFNKVIAIGRLVRAIRLIAQIANIFIRPDFHLIGRRTPTIYGVSESRGIALFGVVRNVFKGRKEHNRRISNCDDRGCPIIFAVTIDRVVSGSAGDRIITAQARDRVVAGTTIQNIVLWRSNQYFIFTCTGRDFIPFNVHVDVVEVHIATICDIFPILIADNLIVRRVIIIVLVQRRVGEDYRIPLARQRSIGSRGYPIALCVLREGDFRAAGQARIQTRPVRDDKEFDRVWINAFDFLRDVDFLLGIAEQDFTDRGHARNHDDIAKRVVIAGAFMTHIGHANAFTRLRFAPTILRHEGGGFGLCRQFNFVHDWRNIDREVLAVGGYIAINIRHTGRQGQVDIARESRWRV